jgi:hypothetical protein
MIDRCAGVLTTSCSSRYTIELEQECRGTRTVKDWNAQAQPVSRVDETPWVGTFDYSSAANAVREQLAALA